MLTKDELAAIRARCEAASTLIENLSLFDNDVTLRLRKSNQDIPILLDEIERLSAELEAENKQAWEYAKRLCKSCINDGNVAIVYGEGPCADCGWDKRGWVSKAEAGRDHWKTRAEALERAIKEFGNIDMICGICVNHEGTVTCNYCRGTDGSLWQFDFERFSGGDK